MLLADAEQAVRNLQADLTENIRTKAGAYAADRQATHHSHLLNTSADGNLRLSIIDSTEDEQEPEHAHDASYRTKFFEVQQLLHEAQCERDRYKAALDHRDGRPPCEGHVSGRADASWQSVPRQGDRELQQQCRALEAEVGD